MSKLFLILGSISAATAVIFGAFGTHSLKTKIPGEMIAVFQTAVQYHFYHSLGLMVIGLLIIRINSQTRLWIAGWVMFIGIILFSGSLYLLSTTGTRWFGIITPFGGIWVAVGVWKTNKDSS
jgi:uncharacterized membrane protein YgdD (TMEM256/DUF423 family)